MQREIKFRVWLGDRMEIIPWNIADKYQDCFQKGGVMQYTGLKDKNGKEIYEGDIVKRYDDIGEVRFDTKFENEGGTFATPGFGFYQIGETGALWHSDCLEIIGNVYENPDLLK